MTWPKEVKQTAKFSLRIVPIKNPVLGAWTDSALYGSEAELLDFDSEEDWVDAGPVGGVKPPTVVLKARDTRPYSTYPYPACPYYIPVGKI